MKYHSDIKVVRNDTPNGKITPSMSRHEKIRALIASALGLAFLFALALAASPQLHARLHPDAGNVNHECAVTLIATGKYHQTDAVPVVVAPQPAIFFAQLQTFSPVWVAAPFQGAHVFAHAPPALS
ncbi:MAG: hypothetical protein ABI883_01600 [Chthoniobacterales bacterium]